MAKQKFPDFSHEKELWANGVELVAGLDEAGRGALAGPVCAASIIFSKDVKLALKVNVSKKRTPQKREELTPLIMGRALTWSVGSAEVWEIEELGINGASELAMQRAFEGMELDPHKVLIDYFKVSFLSEQKQIPLKFGDTLSSSIAAASILAKVFRDKHMAELSKSYPQYGLDFHKGYATERHREMLIKHGPCEIHRESFLSKTI